jgi:hypothetical protein
MPQQNAIERHVEKLDKVYVCNNCRVVFLFQSDVEDHNVTTGHKQMSVLPLDDQLTA